VCNAASDALLQSHFIWLGSGSEGQVGLLSHSAGLIEILAAQDDEGASGPRQMLPAPLEQARLSRVRIGVSDPKQRDLDSVGRAASWLRERSKDPDPIPFGRAKDRQGWPAQGKPDETVTHLRPVELQDWQAHRQSDVFAEAVARATQEQGEPDLVEAPSALQNRHAFGSIAARFAVAMGVSALVALVFVAAFPASQGPADGDGLASLPALKSLRSSLFPAPQRTPAPTLVIRDGSGPVNERLSLGVNVKSPDPGATVTIDRMPAGARLTVGRRMSAGEWRVPAQEISDASVIPPADFVGVMKLTAELGGSDGAALVSSVVRLTWTSARPGGPAVEGASTSVATVPSSPAASTPQQQPQQQQPIASAEPPVAARAEPPAREINPNEVAGFVRRAQELLATGDLQAARLLLLRAAQAHDARAALLLAKSFDPIVSKRFGMADAEPDLAQARNWYQKAEEWGASEARRGLDALASHTR